MLVEEMKAIGRSIIDEAMNKGNVELFDQYFADDFFNHSAGLGTTADRDGLKEMVRMMRDAFEGYHCKLEDLIVEGDKMVFLVRQAGRHTGELMGIPPTNKGMEVLSMSLVRFENDKIVERWNITDELGVMRQLGLV